MAGQFDYCDIGIGCTPAQYVAQFDTAVPRLGSTYVINKGCWMESTIKLVYTTDDGRYIIGQEQGKKYGRDAHGVWVFYASGPWAGWRVNDTARANYRLQEIDV